MSIPQTEKTLSEVDFTKLRDIVHKATGITIATNRKRMLFSRLQRRLKETGSDTFSTYISKVSSDPQEMQELTNRVTTNETYFYRTPRVWSHLKEVTLPAFLNAKTARQMKVWSAAASTGEEAHTVGIMLEDVRAAHAGFDYSVLGTDISSRVIEIAKTGQYIGRPVARFRKEDPDMFAKHMIGNDKDGYCVKPEIKKRLNFKLHNLLQKLSSGGPFDVVFLRNVLIYFSNEDQEKILTNVHAKLRPAGTLIIGESETLKSLESDFEMIAPLIYRPTQRLLS